MPRIDEIAPDIFRISTYIPEADLQFSQFLVRDDEPLLFHTGMRALFPQVLEAVGTLIDPTRLRWIGFSHLEADEAAPSRNGKRGRRRQQRSAASSEKSSASMTSSPFGPPK